MQRGPAGERRGQDWLHAAARQRLPLLTIAFHDAAAIALGILALGISGYLLLKSERDEVHEDLEEVLLLEIAGQSKLLSGQGVARSSPSDVLALAPRKLDSAASPLLNHAQENASYPTS